MSPVLQSMPANPRATTSLRMPGTQTSHASAGGASSAAHAILTAPDIILSAPTAIFPALCEMLHITSESLMGEAVAPPKPASTSAP